MSWRPDNWTKTKQNHCGENCPNCPTTPEVCNIELEAGDQLTTNKAVYASGTMTLTAEADGAGDYGKE